MSGDAEEIEARKIALVVIAPLLGVSRACDLLGLSRDTYYRLAKRVESGGFGAVIDSIGTARQTARRLSGEIEAAVLQISDREPSLGKAKVAARARELGFDVSASGVRSVWQRHNLESALQRVERARAQGLAAAEDRQLWAAVMAEQRRVALELARIAEVFERRPRRSPTKAAQQIADASDTHGEPVTAESDTVRLLRSLFGATPRSECQRREDVDAPSTTPSGASLLASLFSVAAST